MKNNYVFYAILLFVLLVVILRFFNTKEGIIHCQNGRMLRRNGKYTKCCPNDRPYLYSDGTKCCQSASECGKISEPEKATDPLP